MSLVNLRAIFLYLITLVLIGCQSIATNNTNSIDQSITTHPLLPKPQSRFDINNKEGLVTDRLTGLIWSRCAVGMSWNANTQKCINTAIKAPWLNMLDIVNKSTYANRNDWRMPSVSEYTNLVYNDTCDSLSIVIKHLFPESDTLQNNEYWFTNNPQNTLKPFACDLNNYCKPTTEISPSKELKSLLVRSGDTSPEWKQALLLLSQKK